MTDRLEDIVRDEEDHRNTFDRRFDTIFNTGDFGYNLSLFQSIRTCITEGIIIGLSLALVPILAILVLVLFPDDLDVCHG